MISKRAFADAFEKQSESALDTHSRSLVFNTATKWSLGLQKMHVKA